ncbi:hypothetical protein LX13_004110 [Williamsia maris]|uniref:Uncharacterized protein n=2 Tax=Williamsia maris TaxID=72806 RepID=A0ABT1HK09_9NOCA|nr:hypothetical protein [Williamsia maris]
MCARACSTMDRMPVLPRRTSTALAVALSALVILTVGACGNSSSSGPNVPTTTPQTPISAPPTAAAAAGTVVPAPASQSMALDPSTSTLAVLGADRSSLEIYSTAGSGADTAPRRVTLPTTVVAITTVGDGAVAAIAPDAVLRVDTTTGAVSKQDIPAPDPLSLARYTDGSLLVGTGSGSILRVRADGTIARTITGFVRVDGLAVASADQNSGDGQVVALDRAQSSVTTVDVEDGSLGAALRAGDGATGITVDHYGRFLTTDTRGNEFLGFDGNPLVAKFRYPVAAGPYAVGYDDTKNLAWVATTGNNQVVAYDLSTGIPVERRRLATVGQVDSLAVDSATGTVYLLSARGEGLQIIR